MLEILLFDNYFHESLVVKYRLQQLLCEVQQCIFHVVLQLYLQSGFLVSQFY